MALTIAILVFSFFAVGWAALAVILQVSPELSFVVGLLVGGVAYFVAADVYDHLRRRRIQ